MPLLPGPAPLETRQYSELVRGSPDAIWSHIMQSVPDTAVRSKLDRIKGGSPPRVVDLFAGCGGMSLGFLRAGCELVAGVEKESVRARTHARNFFRHKGQAQEEIHAKGRDITQVQPLVCLRELSGHPSPVVDIIVGGPPCQAYARIGRAKLREIARHPRAYLEDARGQLYAAYISWVEALQPVAVVMENVPDILSYGGVNVGEIVARSLETLGYEVRYTLLNAANYGVPQTRERWYLVGIHRVAGIIPSFPKPLRRVNLPVGYRSTRGHASKWNQLPLEDRSDHALPLLAVPAHLQEVVSCEDALSDLPVIPEEVKLGLRGRARDLSARLPYGSPARSEYQESMRTWKGFSTVDTVSAHVIRSLPRDYEIFRRMEEGDEYPAACRIAEEIFYERVSEVCAAGGVEPGDTARWQELWELTVPPYDPQKFPNKWRKLERRLPSRTLMAHLSHDSYTHIHYDSNQARTISVREAARLQSFPDGFEFCGAMNAAFGQVGNAVPPLVAYCIGEKLLAELRAAREPVLEVAVRRSA